MDQYSCNQNRDYIGFRRKHERMQVFGIPQLSGDRFPFVYYRLSSISSEVKEVTRQRVPPKKTQIIAIAAMLSRLMQIMTAFRAVQLAAFFKGVFLGLSSRCLSSSGRRGVRSDSTLPLLEAVPPISYNRVANSETNAAPGMTKRLSFRVSVLDRRTERDRDCFRSSEASLPKLVQNLYQESKMVEQSEIVVVGEALGWSSRHFDLALQRLTKCGVKLIFGGGELLN